MYANSMTANANKHNQPSRGHYRGRGNPYSPPQDSGPMRRGSNPGQGLVKPSGPAPLPPGLQSNSPHSSNRGGSTKGRGRSTPSPQNAPLRGGMMGRGGGPSSNLRSGGHGQSNAAVRPQINIGPGNHIKFPQSQPPPPPSEPAPANQPTIGVPKQHISSRPGPQRGPVPIPVKPKVEKPKPKIPQVRALYR